jgi:ABC-type spermidine/putrescine transport system permease subunit II
MRRGFSDFGTARRMTTIALMFWYCVAVIFLWGPIATALIYSFNLGVLDRQSATLTGWTLRWYPAAWQDQSLRHAVQSSIVVSLCSSLLSVALGSALGYGMVRHPHRRVRRWLAALAYLMLIVPESVIGTSLLLFYAATTVPLGFATMVGGITPVGISVVALIVRARALTLDRRIEEAAADLGSTPWKTLRFIILPQLMPAVAAAGVMAYTFSFDNLVISAFLATPQITTLPVYLYGSLQYGPSPTIYAAASAVFIFTMLMLGLAAALFGSMRNSH